MARFYIIFLIIKFIFLFYPADLFSNTSVAEHIKQKLDQLETNKDFKIAGEKIHNIQYISNLYARNGFQVWWTRPEYIQDALKGLSNAYYDGLILFDYHYFAITQIMKETEESGGPDKMEMERKAELDILLTDGVIFYAYHLLYGKVDPVSLESTWNFGFAPIPDLNPETFRQHIEKGEIESSLLALRPQMPLYDTLLAVLAKYRDIAGKGGWPTILTGGKMEPGDRDKRIPEIRKRLQVSGQLSRIDSILSDFYDKDLETDIKAFQASHGLDADGIIGAGTLRELNVPVEQRIATLRVNLERIRWVAGNMPADYIVVNIAAFWLIMVENYKIVYYTPVMVGRPLNKTPVFRDKIRYIEFNPTWTQPTSIVKNETIPKLKKDSSYLEKNHMILLDTKGNEVPLSDLDLKNLSASNFPYLVRQKPGPWNALGEMKFMFPNKYDIYLHDTPSKSLFARSSRAYSHGCIRVSKPVDLAVKLLEGTKYDRSAIEKILKTHETTRVNLPAPKDILLMYWTSGIDKNGKLYFTPDIYERDGVLLKELDKSLR
jgi:murein L,D-transpeptidase YcbB/YkuD